MLPAAAEASNVRAIAEDAAVYLPQIHVPADITRDVSDTKFLSLASEQGANYLVSNDQRHLLRERRYRRTRIVTPTRFLTELCVYKRTRASAGQAGGIAVVGPDGPLEKNVSLRPANGRHHGGPTSRRF